VASLLQSCSLPGLSNRCEAKSALNSAESPETEFLRIVLRPTENCPRALRNNRFGNMAENVGQAEVAAGVAIGQLLVVQPE